MSLILDALNRADQERKNQDKVPDIHTYHVPSALALNPTPAPNKNTLWLILLIVIGIALGAFALWRSYFSVGVGVQANQANQTNQVSQASPIITESINNQAPAQKQTKQVAQGDATSVSARVASAPSAASTAAAVNNLYTAEPVEQSVAAGEVENLDIEDLYAPSPAEETLSTAFEEPAAVVLDEPAQPLTRPQRITGPGPSAAPRRLDSIPNIPYFNDLPWSKKQQISTISYARHDYLADGVSTVVINGETRGVGNLVSGVFVIEDILEDGVVLRFRDQRFKLHALNGWVNM